MGLFTWGVYTKCGMIHVMDNLLLVKLAKSDISKMGFDLMVQDLEAKMNGGWWVKVAEIFKLG